VINIRKNPFSLDPEASSSSLPAKRKRDEKRMQNILTAEDQDSDGNPEGDRPKKSARKSRKKKAKRDDAAKTDAEDNDFSSGSESDSDSDVELVMTNEEVFLLPTSNHVLILFWNSSPTLYPPKQSWRVRDGRRLSPSNPPKTRQNRRAKAKARLRCVAYLPFVSIADTDWSRFPSPL
jgi:hypothetical protein